VARYADRLLSEGEDVVLRTRQHWLALLIKAGYPVLLFIVALVLLLFVSQLVSGTARDLVGYAGFIALLISLLWLVKIYITWYSEDYLVTNRRVIKVEGIINKHSADSSLEKINDAVLQQSLFGRMLGYGDLDIMTAAEESVDRYRMLSQAQTFKRTMLDEKHKLEQEVFQIPAPPLRATTLPPPPPAQPAPVAAPAGPRELSSDEITSALGNLADLRDRGAISPEDYEAKKQDLLGRL
jgi:hypothetical protein